MECCFQPFKLCKLQTRLLHQFTLWTSCKWTRSVTKSSECCCTDDNWSQGSRTWHLYSGNCTGSAHLQTNYVKILLLTFKAINKCLIVGKCMGKIMGPTVIKVRNCFETTQFPLFLASEDFLWNQQLSSPYQYSHPLNRGFGFHVVKVIGIGIGPEKTGWKHRSWRLKVDIHSSSISTAMARVTATTTTTTVYQAQAQQLQQIPGQAQQAWHRQSAAVTVLLLVFYYEHV